MLERKCDAGAFKPGLISIYEDGRADCSGQDLHLLKLERHLELEARMRNTQHRGLPCADGILC